MRALPVLTLLVFLARLGFARTAVADEAVVVLDRGETARAVTAKLERITLRLLDALEGRGFDTRLVVYGTRTNGRVRAATPRGAPADALEELREREGWDFEGPTDPRHALDAARSANAETSPALVLLVGPFGRLEGGEVEDESAVEALAAWNAGAADETRVFATGLPEARAKLIEAARGCVADGSIVLSVAEVEVETAPFSPFEDGPLRARVRVPLELLEAGGEPPTGLLGATSADARDVIVSKTPGGFALERPDATSRVATLSFDGADPRVLWLCEAPPPRTFCWTSLKPDAVLRTPDGTAPLAFERSGVQADAPFTRTYRLLRTRVGPPPAWTAQAVAGDLPVELTVAFSPETVSTKHTLFTEVVVTCRARAGAPLDAAGTVRIRANDHPSVLDLPFRIQVPPGRVEVRLDAPDAPLALPAAEDTPPWGLLVAALNANSPRLVRIEAVLQSTEMAQALTAHVTAAGGMDVAWDLAQPLELRPSVRYALRVELKRGVRGIDGAVRLHLPEQRGVEGQVLGTGRIARRHPRLTPSAATYRMDGGSVVGDPPLRLEVDADGGTGAWRLALLETPPVVTTPPDAPFDLEVRPEGPGRWAVVPTGEWRGARADIFTPRTRTFVVDVAWDAGAAPGSMEIPVRIEPRWGSVGWILVGLAVLALALGLWGTTQLRAAPVEGTLLYTVRGREGAVGRLDLAPVGRRKTRIHADEAGRLLLGSRGPRGAAHVATVKPTRVGGLLVVEGPEGDASHLLVDGLSLSTEGHGLRYVSGAPDDAVVPLVPMPEADLLGPEYDMGTGRIDALGRKTDEASAEGAEPDA